MMATTRIWPMKRWHLIGVVALLMGLPLVFTIVVVNFIGGYIPYIGAFLGGGLAVIIALGDGGDAGGPEIVDVQ